MSGGGLGEIWRLIREKGVWHVIGNVRRNAAFIYNQFKSRGGGNSRLEYINHAAGDSLSKPLIQQQPLPQSS